MSADAPRRPGQPYCGHCGYDLEGLTESSRCPECGRPIVEVLRRASDPRLQSGRRYRSAARLFGMPAIDVAFGPRDGELRGKARGFLAIGDDAVGVVAIGGFARGLVAVGGAAIGGFSLGGFSIGAVVAVGGGAISTGLAVAGGAIGGIAKAGGAAGYVADGGGAVGYWARGGGAFGPHALGKNTGANDPAAAAFFDSMSWLLGAPLSIGGFLQTFAIALGLIGGVGGLLALWAWTVHRREPDDEPARG